ncbi:MAG: Atrophin-1 multi-domain protein [Alphaproteobacteria bacterium]|nr:MAG: Atrophin-1 multi-domain protein [Alphaproteobacteria bacterium]
MPVNTLHTPIEMRLLATLIAAILASGCSGGGSSSSSAAATAAEVPADGAATIADAPASSAATEVPSTEQAAVAAAAVIVPAAPASGATPEIGAALAPAATMQPASATTSTIAAACPPDAYGSFDRPFAAGSPWNSRPVAPVLGSTVVPKSLYFPAVASGTYASVAFEAKATDGPMVVTSTKTSGVWDPDSEVYRPSITIPHWPTGVIPATGLDGHAEIVDTAMGVVHSFWQLKQVEGAWKATQYAWTPLAGRGMGDPSHYFQGARAAGVSTLGGLMRKSEVEDGRALYKHALAMSLTNNGLSRSPAYNFPATSADSDAATVNTGPIPMGSRLMLPASFNAQALATPELRKVAETLKTYGAFVVDRNYGTPFVIYVEIGANFKLHKNGWSNATANDLDVIRAALRPLQSAASWLDGNDKPTAIANNSSLNLLSMRGYWYRSKGTQSGTFDTWKQALVFPATTTPIEQSNTGGRAYAGVVWSTPTAGESYRLSVSATGGAMLRVKIVDKTTGTVVLYDSGDMSNAQTADFAWPIGPFKILTYAKSGIGGVESTVSAQLVKNGAPVAAQCGV